MYFISRNNKVYAYLIRLSQPLWYVITIGCALLICLLWWKSFYGPLRLKERKFTAEHKALLQQQDAFARILHANKKLKDEVSELDTSVRECLSCLQSHQIPLKKFINKALESGLTLVSYAPKETVCTKWYVIHEVEAGFIGTYEDVVRLLQVLSIRQDLIRMETFSLRHEGETLYLQCLINVSEGLA